MIREYLQDNILITDGAMGTYYSEITGRRDMLPEMANLSDPDIIERIHNEYIAAGAKLIKSNTFSANSSVLGVAGNETKKIIVAGAEIAKKAASGKNVFVAASIGPIPEMAGKEERDPADIAGEYKFMADVFLECGIKIFIFETFSELTFLPDVAKYIKAKDAAAFVLTQYATTPAGFTRRGVSIDGVIAKIRRCASIDAYGFNCGVGPTHLYNNLKDRDFAGDLVAVAPNAGYPEIIRERTVYVNNAGYFAERMQEISGLGVRILGGCCGTTPEHIKKMAALISPGAAAVFPKTSGVFRTAPAAAGKQPNVFQEKLNSNKFVIAVELDPPFNADSKTIINNARICRENGVDIVTVADSPMGRARVDSIMLAAKIKREAGIDVIPHICCRDRNTNALKSALLASHIENIRNVLAVTGDPVAEADKGDIKGVFNLNSYKLIELIAAMNKEFFPDDPINIGGALNLNVVNPEGETARMFKKNGKGAGFFLTQPIYDDNVIDYLPGIAKKGEVRLLGGIMPLVSYRNAQFLNNEVSGIRIPERIINKFDPAMDKEKAEDLGVEIAVEIAEKIKGHVDGLYFITPFNRVGMIVKIIKKLGL